MRALSRKVTARSGQEAGQTRRPLLNAHVTFAPTEGLSVFQRLVAAEVADH